MISALKNIIYKFLEFIFLSRLKAELKKELKEEFENQFYIQNIEVNFKIGSIIQIIKSYPVSDYTQGILDEIELIEKVKSQIFKHK